MQIRLIAALLCGAFFTLFATTGGFAQTNLGGNIGSGIGRDHLAKKPVASKQPPKSELQIKNIPTGPGDDAKAGASGTAGLPKEKTSAEHLKK